MTWLLCSTSLYHVTSAWVKKESRGRILVSLYGIIRERAALIGLFGPRDWSRLSLCVLCVCCSFVDVFRCLYHTFQTKRCVILVYISSGRVRFLSKMFKVRLCWWRSRGGYLKTFCLDATCLFYNYWSLLQDFIILFWVDEPLLFKFWRQLDTYSNGKWGIFHNSD